MQISCKCLEQGAIKDIDIVALINKYKTIL